jgi:hypothetical protein
MMGGMSVVADSAVCLGCGYSLKGLAAEVCPECGKSFAADDPTTYEHVPINARQIFAVALRVLGVYAILHSLGSLVYAVAGALMLFGNVGGPGPVPSTQSVYMILSGVHVVIAWVISIWLIFRAERVAEFVYRVPASSYPVKLLHINAEVIYSVFCKLLGIYALLRSIQPGSNAVIRLVSDPSPLLNEPFLLAEVLQAVLFVVAGVLLLFGPRRVGGWLAKVRYVPPEEEERGAGDSERAG